MNDLPIDLDVLQKSIEVPKRIAELTYVDQEKAIEFMRLWGENRITISEIHEQLSEALRNNTVVF